MSKDISLASYKNQSLETCKDNTYSSLSENKCNKQYSKQQYVVVCAVYILEVECQAQDAISITTQLTNCTNGKPDVPHNK